MRFHFDADRTTLSARARAGPLTLTILTDPSPAARLRRHLRASVARKVQEPWTYDERTLRIYRSYVLLHEQLVPYIRAAAATGQRCGLPIIRPLHLTDPSDDRGWTIADAYGFGHALWAGRSS